MVQRHRGIWARNSIPVSECLATKHFDGVLRLEGAVPLPTLRIRPHNTKNAASPVLGDLQLLSNDTKRNNVVHKTASLLETLY
jgi:hypothetical protein